MKTPEEIVDWLKSHEWYDSFVKNLKDNYAKDEEKGIRDSYLNGLEGRSTILGAFRWSEHPYNRKDGANFWSIVHDDFKEWFEN